MNITEVRVRLVKKDDGKLKAVASVTIDNCFVVHDVKILEGNEDYFIAMPSKKTPEGEPAFRTIEAAYKEEVAKIKPAADHVNTRIDAAFDLASELR